MLNRQSQDKYSGILSQLTRDKDNILFQNNVEINIKKIQCQIASKKFGEGIPYSVFYLDERNNEIKEKTLVGANLAFSVVLFKENEKYNCILLDRALAQSILVRLYFFNGVGLKYFKPFIHESDLTRRTEIKVFEVDWEKFEEDLSRE